MATGFKYTFGKYLGGVLFIAYLVAAILGVGGSAHGLDTIMDFTAWYFWLLSVLAGLLILWFIPRPVDVMLLSPLAIYGGVHQWGLTWTMATIIVGLPVIIVLLLSLGHKS